MRILYSDEFVKLFRKLPSGVQRLYRKQEKVFQENWRDSRLHTKKLIEHPFPFSFRVTRNYRVLFLFVEDETVLMATIGHRKDVYG